MVDWNEPTTLTLNTDVLDFINEKFESCVTFFETGGSDTNFPVGTKRSNSSNDDKLERWDGSTWDSLEFHDIYDAHIADTAIHQPPPTGVINMWSTNSAPSGYLLCDGSAVSRTTYSGLFGVIGTTYGVGDGSTTFNVPNMKARIPVGRDSGIATVDTLGETFGALDHTHSLPGHTHTINSHTHDLSNHIHGQPAHTHTTDVHAHQLPGHYHDAQAPGADINITASGTHVHQISSVGGGSADMFFSSTYQFGRCNMPGGTSFQYGNTDYDASGPGQGTGPTHTHPHSSIVGKVGPVSTGANGDGNYNSFNGGGGSTSSSGGDNTLGPSVNLTGGSGTLTSNSGGSGTSGSGNPPCFVINYIIKT